MLVYLIIFENARPKFRVIFKCRTGESYINFAWIFINGYGICKAVNINSFLVFFNIFEFRPRTVHVVALASFRHTKGNSIYIFTAMAVFHENFQSIRFCFVALLPYINRTQIMLCINLCKGTSTTRNIQRMQSYILLYLLPIYTQKQPL